MELALIPPISEMSDIQYRSLHLLLPQLFNNQNYINYYTYMPKGETRNSVDKTYILDNGAAEGCVVTLEALHQIGATLNVDEIVIPDIMGDPDATYRGMCDMRFSSRFDYMYVAHGHSIAEVLDYVDKVFDKQFYEVTTIGLPRILFSTVSDNDGLSIDLRVKLAKTIKALSKNYGLDVNIHLLGAHPLWYWEAKLAASVPEIRSMDTSLPYMLAQHGVHLHDKETRDLPPLTRKHDYFMWSPSARQRWLINWNIETMDRWVSSGRS